MSSDSVPLAGTALVLALLALGMAAGGAAARDLRITVYNNNLGLVHDEREVDVPQGTGTIELADVPAQIDPTSVHLKPSQGSVDVLEQNFQYDLANPDRILQRYLDQNIDAVLKDGGAKSGTLLSYDGGGLVLRGEDGAVELLTRDQVVDLRLPRLPEGLRTRPTLVWHLRSSKGGRMPVALTYLTAGLTWHAEYVAVVNDDDSRIDLTAWVSLENTSGATYPEATLQLIAGEVQRVRPAVPMLAKGMRANVPMAEQAAPGFQEESFFEYHLYTLDRPTTLADRETKQLALFPPAGGPVSKIYEYNGQRDTRGVRVVIQTENRKENGLGMPLPAGTVRVYKRDPKGNLQFVGEDRIEHTPKNEKIRLTVGRAFDIVGERNDLSVNRISDRVQERTTEVRLRNRKEEPAEVVVQEPMPGDWTITQSSVPFTKKDAHTAEFRVPVAADSETVLTYTVRIQY